MERQKTICIKLYFQHTKVSNLDFPKKCETLRKGRTHRGLQYAVLLPKFNLRGQILHWNVF